MKTFNITIVIYKQIILLIFPFKWELTPRTESPDYNTISHRQELVEIRTKESQDHWEKIYDIMHVARRSERGLLIYWLCFRLQITYMKSDSDVTRIYPKGYDYKSDPKWLEKFKELENTGYFS
jgi:hypothetical protein